MAVVDIENIARRAIHTRQDAMTARRLIEGAGLFGSTDHVVVGTSHYGAIDSGLAWPGARLVVKSGPNGADLALIDVLATEHVAERFDEIVLVSGDGIFTDAIAELGRLGLPVTLLAWQHTCARRLRMAAAHAYFLEEEQLTIGAVA